MPFNDLSAQAREGLTYAANRLSNEDKARRGATMPDPANPTGPQITRPDLYPDGKAYMDFGAEAEGCKWYETKQETRRLKRLAALEKPANAALAAQVDALG